MRIAIRVMMIFAIVAFVSDVTASSQQGRNRSRVRQLIQAADAGDTTKVLQLLNSKVDVNATYDREESRLSGKTALMAASSRGHSDLVQTLIKRGANVNLKHRSGETALMFAAGSGSQSTVKALLHAGAEVDVIVGSPHAGEFTPVSVAIYSDQPQRFEIVRI